MATKTGGNTVLVYRQTAKQCNTVVTAIPITKENKREIVSGE